MKDYFLLLRPKHWAKNLFLLVPSFFAAELFVSTKLQHLIGGFFSFSFMASSIYIINDYRDLEDDRKHPEKCKRPLASGKVNPQLAILIAIILVIAGTIIGYAVDPSFEFLTVLGIYFLMNLAYSFGLKNIAILDILILAAGFVLRIKGGAIIAKVDVTTWLTIMTFLLALFMAIAKRRDDMLLKISTGNDMRKSINGYNLDFLNIMLALFSAIIIVAYIMYTVDNGTMIRLQTYRLYYTSLFVMAGVMRYLQITFVEHKSASPTEILYRDRFIQFTILLWILSFYAILYLKNVTIFKR